MRKMNRVVAKVNACVVGLDVHKISITYCILDREGNVSARGRLPAERERLEEFARELEGEFQFALEASGYALWVYDTLVRLRGREQVHVAHAAHVRAIANSPRKNDDNDAFWLAYLTYEGRLPEAQLPEGDLRELRLATRHRIRLVRRQTKLKSQVRGLLAQVGSRVLHKLDSAKGRGRVEEILAGGELSKVRAECLRDLLEQLDDLNRRAGRWEERIDGIASASAEVAAIRAQLPGVGKVLAPAVYAETGDPRRFSSAKALGSYTGFPPTDRSSGGRTRHGRMTRTGSPFLRWALVEAIVACQKVREGPGKVIGDWVRRRQARMGDKRRAQCAAARKLAEAIWRLFSYGESFDAAKAFRG